MGIYYLSLVRGLSGYYVKFKATSAEVVSRHAAEYFGRMWCSVYSEDYFNLCIAGKYRTEHIINPDDPIELGGEWQWE